MTDTNIRTAILRAAEKTITQDRQDQYGAAEDSFTLIAQFWSAYLGTTLSAYDVAQMMVLLKVARGRANPTHADNAIDVCGYAALGAELASPAERLPW